MPQNPSDVKRELIAIADELDRRGLRGMADEVTQILASVVREERVASLPDPEYLVQVADQLDQEGRYDEADRVTAYAQRVAMTRSAQAPTDAAQQEDPVAEAKRKFWKGRRHEEFYAEPGVATGWGNPAGGEYSGVQSLQSMFNGGPELYKRWKRNVWDKWDPVQQEDFRARSGMASAIKPLNQELYDYWSRNIAPGLRQQYLGTQMPASRTPADRRRRWGRRRSPDQQAGVGAAAPDDVQYSMSAGDLEAKIEQKRRELQWLENTLAQRGSAPR